MKGWDEVRAWRLDRRREILAARQAMRQSARKAAGERITAALSGLAPALARGAIGFYWPFKAEPDLRSFVSALVAAGGAAALPVVVQERRPLEFWAWRPGIRMAKGIWNIPIPAERNLIHPDVVLVPLLGFDAAGYRLGYGGGYYDRTLAAMSRRPLTIGVGYEQCRLETIFPQAHDVAMDAVVTEAGLRWTGSRRLTEGVENAL